MIFQSVITFFVLSSLPAVADTGPYYDQIFSLGTSQGLYPCSKLPNENSYCEEPLAVVDSQGKSQGAKLVKKFSVDGGEGSWFFAIESRKTLNAKECLIQASFHDGSHPFVKAECENIQGVEKVLQELTSTSQPSLYIFNPDLKEVSVSKDAKTTIPLQEVFALKDNPNPRIGTLAIVLDPPEARDPKSKKVLMLSFPGKGEAKFTASQLLVMKQQVDLSLSEDAQAQALKEPFVIRVPVYRKSGNRYLVDLPNFMAAELGPDQRGAIGDEVTISKFYSWLEDGGVHLKFEKEIKEKMNYYLEAFPVAASLKFKMERGDDFLKGAQKWTSLKISASHVDFEASDQKDENGNKGYLSRKKVFLREIFFPLFDSKGHINLWLGWEPGC